MQVDISKYVKECSVCQQCKHSSLSPAGHLQPLPVPENTWDEVTMDFIEGLPRSNGWDAIWVVVDRLIKYAHFILLKHPFSAATVAQTFIKEVVRLHGLPKSIVSDRDRIFLSQFWVELFKLHGVQLKRSIAYHPQTDGQSEVYNTSFHSSTKCTPFRALYGRDPPTIMRYEGQVTTLDALDKMLEDRDVILDDLKVHLM
uniref:Integrase catalytic domain-containing protein n=1 Tax=Lactuca sativa TaxID=4236 RepID=A0A9R1XX91_LACSA|nr:hypothetical protein LSAT_V11C100008020 [Lactuca sativa]